MAIYSTKNVVNPIFEVVESLRKIAKGDFSQRIKVKRQNEIGELATAFNVMSGKLNESINEIERSEQRYHNLIEFADVGIIVANDDKIIQVNKKAEEIYGYSKNELITQSPKILTLDEYSKQHREIFREILTNGNPKKIFVEEEGVRKDGSIFPLEISYSLSESTDNGKYNVIAIMRDITERKLHQEELQRSYNEMELRVRERTDELKQAKEAAEGANRTKSDFLANMSHELRTPLNHIIGFTELIADKKFGELNETQTEYLNDVITSSRHLLSLINDILDLSKVESGKMELSLSDIDLRVLLANSLVMFKEKSLKHGIQLSTAVDHVPQTIAADERKLKQIVYNLLSNAMKFTMDGGKVLLSARMVDCIIRPGQRWSDPEDLQIIEDQINIDESTGAECKRCVEFSVSDTGIGIKPEDQERIFSPFEQVEESASRKYQGTGLGLSLTRKLVELHGGRIWVKSEGEGKGSTFSFSIPV
jgi:PAS domain S-box-containing protein